MQRLAAWSLPILAVLALLGCGDALSLFSTAPSGDLTIAGPEDGAVLPAGQAVTIQVAATNPLAHPGLEVRATLLSATGESVWDERREGPAVNEDIAFTLPDLPPGQYRLDIVVLEEGEQVARRTTTIFTVTERPRIAGIASFPPLITASSPVLLTADLAAAGSADPWLRWSWRGKTLAEGARSSGAASVLWTAPPDEGVYTLTLELFPAPPPAGTRFAFRSSIVMSTDIYVAAAGSASRDELGPAASYLVLFHFRADLADAAARARDLERAAVPIGSPQVVPVGDGFGWRLENGARLGVPWPILPVEDGLLAPFTLSVGVRAERMTGADRILAATAGGLGVTLQLGSGGSPEAVIAGPGGAVTTVASGAPSLAPNRRYLLSVSVEPRVDGAAVRWFIDGRQVSETTAVPVAAATAADGSATVGDTGSFAVVVDELGVYVRDEAGRPATDPGLLGHALRREHGGRLLLADGFDGMYLPAGFTAGPRAQIGAGRLELPPATSVDLPPVAVPADGFSLEVALDDEATRPVDVRVAWAGEERNPFVNARMVAVGGTVRLEFSARDVAAATPDGNRRWTLGEPPAEKAGIVVSLGCPADARSPLALDSVVALAPASKP